jgi:hypothetical protein
MLTTILTVVAFLVCTCPPTCLNLAAYTSQCCLVLQAINVVGIHKTHMAEFHPGCHIVLPVLLFIWLACAREGNLDTNHRSGVCAI